jgi:hypothetical protein
VAKGGRLTSLGLPGSFSRIRLVKFGPDLPGASTRGLPSSTVRGFSRSGRFLDLSSQSESPHGISLTGRGEGIIHGIEMLGVGGGELTIDVEDKDIVQAVGQSWNASQMMEVLTRHNIHEAWRGIPWALLHPHHQAP